MCGYVMAEIKLDMIHLGVYEKEEFMPVYVGVRQKKY